MSELEQDIFNIMKALGTGQSTGGKTLKFNPQNHKLSQEYAGEGKQFREAIDPKTKMITIKYTTKDDPDLLPEIDPSDAIVF